MTEFRMPSLGADMDKGTILEWRVSPGDEVHRGDIVAVVDTEKSDVEVEVFTSGVIEEILVGPGEEVPVGTVLARIREIGRSPEVSASDHVVTSPLVRHLAAAEGVDVAAIPATGSGGMVVTRRDVERAGHRPRVSPRARRLAEAAGLEPKRITGTGPSGSVTGSDVISAVPGRGPTPRLSAPLPPPASGGADLPDEKRSQAGRLDTLRSSVAGLMERSKREIPHYYLDATIDMTRSLSWLGQLNESRPVTERVLPAALLLRATARAAVQVPEVNGFWSDGRFQAADAVHLGVAISLREGALIAPTIRDADSMGVDDLMAALRGLVARARAGALRSSEMSAPTITVTNLGDQGADAVFGVIYPPQVALVGFGRFREVPWAERGMVGVRRMVRTTLSGDHRASDGHRGSRFLSLIDRLLQEPADL